MGETSEYHAGSLTRSSESCSAIQSIGNKSEWGVFYSLLGTVRRKRGERS